MTTALVSMGAPAIYHIPNRRRSGCSAVINNATNTSNTGVNGLDRRILNYDKYLKVRLTILTDPLVALCTPTVFPGQRGDQLLEHPLDVPGLESVRATLRCSEPAQHQVRGLGQLKQV